MRKRLPGALGREHRGQAEERVVDGLGAVRHEGHLFGQRADQRGGLGPGRLEAALRREAVGVRRRRVAPVLVHEGQHRVRDLLVHRRGAVVVQVDRHLLPPLAAIGARRHPAKAARCGRLRPRHPRCVGRDPSSRRSWWVNYRWRYVGRG